MPAWNKTDMDLQYIGPPKLDYNTGNFLPCSINLDFSYDIQMINGSSLLNGTSKVFKMCL